MRGWCCFYARRPYFIHHLIAKKPLKNNYFDDTTTGTPIQALFGPPYAIDEGITSNYSRGVDVNNKPGPR